MDLLVVLSFLLVSFAEIIFPIALGHLLVKKYKLSWKVYLLGAFFFILVQLVHTLLVLVMQAPATHYIGKSFPDKGVSIAVYAVILGLLAGLFEELGRYIVYVRFFTGNKMPLSVENGTLFGAGWGGVESIIIGLLMLLTTFSYMAASPLTDAQISQINESMGGTLTEEKVFEINNQLMELIALTPSDIFPGLAERIFAITLHIAWSVMVLRAVVEKRSLLLWTAVLWHSATDTLAVYVGQVHGVMAAETLLLCFALIGVLYLKGSWAAARAKKPV